MLHKVFFMISVIVVFTATGLSQQTGQVNTDTMEIVRESVAANKRALVAINMGFTEEQSQQFWPLYENYQRVRW